MPLPSNVPEDADLLKSVLPPLLNDFQHWFSRTIDLLESQTLSFLSDTEQATLLDRVREAQKEVGASQALAAATDSRAGIDMSVMMGWHGLVHECWGVAIRHRRDRTGDDSSLNPPPDSQA